MNVIDIIILLALAYGAFKGFIHGLIIEVATLLALVLGVILSMKFSGMTEAFLVEHMNASSEYLSYIAFAVTFLLVAIGIFLLGKFLSKMVDMAALGLANKIAGAIFGAAKILVVVCALLLVVDTVDDKFHLIGEETKKESLLYTLFTTFAHQIYDLVLKQA